MTIDFLDRIPEILLLFLPGYIALRIKEKYTLGKKADNLNMIILSVLYSFIIGLFYSVLGVFYSIHEEFFLRIFSQNLVTHNITKQLLYYILAIFFGYFLVKKSTTKLGNKITKFFNRDIIPKPSIWIEAMKNSETSWVKVYLKNGMMYRGELIDYTLDSNDSIKKLLLCNYKLYIRSNNNENNKSKDILVKVNSDSTNNHKARVLLNGDTIDSIEIVPYA